LWNDLQKTEQVTKNKSTEIESVEGDESERIESLTIRGDLIAKCLLDIYKKLADSGYPVTFTDAIEATLMTQRLANLRGCIPGRMEIRDVVTSCFLKQANDESAETFYRVVNQILAGNRIGVIAQGLPIAPIVADFHQACQRFKLPINKRDPVERSLDIYRSQSHRGQSHFLHQLQFLDIGYANRVAGPDFVQGVDLQRVRETWKVRWSIEIEPKLVECSDYGHSIAEAAFAKLREAFDQPQHIQSTPTAGANGVSLLLSSLVMGLHDLIDPIIERIQRWCCNETSVISLGDALHKLFVASHFQTALSLKQTQNLLDSLQLCFERTCVRLPWIGIVPDEHVENISNTLIMMSGLVSEEIAWGDPDLFYSNLQTLLKNRGNSQCIGVATGILLVAQKVPTHQTKSIITEYLAYVDFHPEMTTSFLFGFVMVMKGRLCYEPDLIELINTHFMALEQAQFLQLLPGLRLAFSQLSPREVRELACSLGDDTVVDWHEGGDWPQSTLEFASELRHQLEAIESQWGWLK